MLSILNPWKPAAIALAVIGALSLGYGALGWSRANHWHKLFNTLTGQAKSVLIATRDASDNPDLKWADVTSQVNALGQSNRQFQVAIIEQNESIDKMAAEAVQLKARAIDLRKIADAAQMQRKAALTRLSDMSVTPGTRDDCEMLLKEANNALDLVWEAGL